MGGQVVAAENAATSNTASRTRHLQNSDRDLVGKAVTLRRRSGSPSVFACGVNPTVAIFGVRGFITAIPFILKSNTVPNRGYRLISTWMTFAANSPLDRRPNTHTVSPFLSCPGSTTFPRRKIRVSS